MNADTAEDAFYLWSHYSFPHPNMSSPKDSVGDMVLKPDSRLNIRE